MASVLIVDDDADASEPLEKILSAAGHQVTSAVNGKDALSAVLAQTPDAVVLDLFMPEMDGVMFLDVIRSYLRFHSLPVVVLTGVPDSSHIDRVRKLGVDAVVAKGDVPLDEIRKLVEQAIARHHTA